MEMFLMLAAISLLGVAVSAALFAAATRDVRRPPEAGAADKPSLPASHFFAEDPGAAPASVEARALLLQIERHIRLEQAAAESFLRSPNAESLHSGTTSPLKH